MKGYWILALVGGLAAGTLPAQEAVPEESVPEGAGLFGEAPQEQGKEKGEKRGQSEGVQWSAQKIDKSGIKGVKTPNGARDVPEKCRCEEAREKARTDAAAAEGKTAVAQCATCKKYRGAGPEGKELGGRCETCVRAQLGGGGKCDDCLKKRDGIEKKKGKVRGANGG